MDDKATRYRSQGSIATTGAPFLGFLGVVPTTEDDVGRRCFHVLDAEGYFNGLQPTLPSGHVALSPIAFCTSRKPRAYNCGAVPL